uniref:NADH-ubiquinone oxidoreductase chain 6 n=1 Tax=Konosirus punctatus TaxID=365056 RepID=I6PEA2_KONPU|nr:NADH dehydrogenase subunit 6 [Konosirus punctatus]QNH68292.1 NADH dehydrogenase subunit 6 [Konosirus punctatus]UQS79357.1 NADH dehydrogenase subunit 6 [Konosirus punctatus]
MVSTILLLLAGFMMGLVGVASYPSPYFGAMGLVLSSAAGCAVLAMFGTPFLALSLFLIYLGGMLVVFGYAAALSADEFPEDWTDVTVFEYAMFYLLGLVVAVLYFGRPAYEFSVGMLTSVKEFLVVRGDLAGVAVLYGVGGMLMLFCAWVLLLTLFVVLELVRGRSRGSMRAP